MVKFKFKIDLPLGGRISLLVDSVENNVFVVTFDVVVFNVVVVVVVDVDVFILDVFFVVDVVGFGITTRASVVGNGPLQYNAFNFMISS